VGILQPYLRELLASSLEAEANLPTSMGESTTEAQPAQQEVLWEWYPGEPEQMAPQEKRFEGDSAHPSQLLAVCHTRQTLFFQHNLTVRASGSLKLGNGSPQLGPVSLLPRKSRLQSLFSEAKPGQRMGTHQLGAFVGAIPREDKGFLARGNGHHWCVDQAQLHDAGVVASQSGRVVKADSRGVTATWQMRGQGCKSLQEK